MGWVQAGAKPVAATAQDPVEERIHALEDENDQLKREIARLKSNQQIEQGPTVHFSVN